MNLAKLAGQVERYEEIVQSMQKLVIGSTPAVDLTVEEWQKNEDHVVLVKEYKSEVENKPSNVRASVLSLLDLNLIQSATASESKVLHLK